MTEGFIIKVDEETWDNATEEERKKMSYKFMVSIDRRLTKIEKRPLTSRIESLIGGTIGGFLASIGIRLGG